MADRPTQIARPLSDRLRDIPDHRAGSGTVALLLHAFAIVLIVYLSQVAPSATGTGPLGLPGTGGGGGGGEVIHYVELPGDPAPPPPPEVTPPVIPEVEPELVVPVPLPDPEPEVVVMVDSIPLSATLPPQLETGTGTGAGAPELGSGGGPGSGGGSGGGDGGGDGPGTGTGSGPGTGGGDGTLGRDPAPRMLLFPPSPVPNNVKGKSVTVHLIVDAQGAVRQVVAIEPGTGNGRYDDDIRRTARSWQFRPGTDASGVPVVKPFQVELSF